MADLIAQGPMRHLRWRRALPDGQTVVLGRASEPLTVPWDDQISRRHAELRWRHGRLEVARLVESRNAVYYDGKPVERFALAPGEHFVIGQTTFSVEDRQVCVSLVAPKPKLEQSFSPDYLRQLQFRNSRARIDVLARLPEVMAGAATDAELYGRLVNLLLSGVPAADAAAVVALDESLIEQAESDQSAREADTAETKSTKGPRRGTGATKTDSAFTPRRDDTRPRITVLHWDRHPTAVADFQPSQELIRHALRRGESILHVWSAGSESTFTAAENVDWAFCTPAPGEASRGLAIYVAGRFQSQGDPQTSPTDAADLHDDLKFTEIAAQTLCSLREVRRLQQRQAGLRQFFSPVVLETLSNQDPESALAPRPCHVTVLFCDLRGFSLESERADDLMALLQRVSSALGLTTRHILAEGGVVGDFQGDAVMGFWGWPIAQPDAADRACRAALAIRRHITRAAGQTNDALAGFRMGMGLATGAAVAGKIGTVDQVKVTVFGPVVNLASRLESLTKTLRAPILLDETTAEYVAKKIAPTIARRRRLARVRPAGLDTPLTVSELLPPAIESATNSAKESTQRETDYVPTDGDVAHYENAFDAFGRGDWDRAFAELHQVSAADRAKDFLVAYIAGHNRTAPENWDGVIRLEKK